MPEPTPGQIAYAAYCGALDGHWTKPAWAALLPEIQRAWEAAAQAVGEQAITDLLLVQRLAQGEDADDAHADT